MQDKDYYKILGVTPDMSKEEIKAVFLELSKIFHPDKYKGRDNKFKEINEAYKAITGSHSQYYRQKYSSSRENDIPETNKAEQKESTEKDEVKKDTNNMFLWIISIITISVFSLFYFYNKEGEVGNNVELPAVSKEVSNVVLATNSPISQPKNIPCVNEDKDGKVGICDLYSESIVDGDNRKLKMSGNKAYCVDLSKGTKSSFESNGEGVMYAYIPNIEYIYCVSDFGNIYVSPYVNVNKYYGKLTMTSGYPDYNYEISRHYDSCIWTYVNGNAAIPYIDLATNFGTSLGVRAIAFCKKDNRSVDIYSYIDSDFDYDEENKNREIENRNLKNTVELLNKNISFNDVSYLQNFAGKYTSDIAFFDNSIIRQRLQSLMGSDYNYIEKYWNVTGPISVDGDYFIAYGCKAHDCSSTNFKLVINLKTNKFYVIAKIDDWTPKQYFEDNNPPAQIYEN